MKYNLDALGPDEQKKLLEQLLAEREGGSDAGHPDAEQDQEMINPIIEALELLTNRVEELERLVIDELFGGIEKLYKENQRTTGVGALRDKYGELFSPHSSALEALAPGEDVFEKIYDLLDGQEMDDTGRDEAVKGFAGSLAEKIARIKGEAPASDGAPVTVEIEKTTTIDSENDKAEPVEDDFLAGIRRMAKAAKK